jgi:cytochrome o ubiquinol oxidase operon protein cyoD
MSTKSKAKPMQAEPVLPPLVQKKLVEYIIGFVLSLGLTLTAYALAVGNILEDWGLLYILAALAIVQAIVQLLFFLHLRDESEPRWKLLVFDFMLVIVTILVFGSIWIMNNLHYNMMSPQETDQHIIQDEGIYR